jgi:hypothetical protein
VNLVGRAYTALRETRMAAVVCSMGDPGAGTMADADAVARSLVSGVRRSFSEPAPEPGD